VARDRQVSQVRRVEGSSEDAEARHRRSIADLPVALDEVLEGAQLAQADRAARVKLLRRVADLRPHPELSPSVKRVDAFTYTQAASTPSWKARAAAVSRVTIASEWPLPWRAMCSIASSTESTRPTAQRHGEILGRPVLLAGRLDDREPHRACVGRHQGAGGSSARTSTPAHRARARCGGTNRAATCSWINSVSAALQTPGRCVFALINDRFRLV